MARYEFKFPDLGGEGLSEAELINLHVKVGDQVKEGDTLMEVQTAKANVEIPSPVSGTVAEIRFKAGDTIHVGDVVLVIETGGGEATLQLRKPIEVTQQAAPPPPAGAAGSSSGNPAGGLGPCRGAAACQGGGGDRSR